MKKIFGTIAIAAIFVLILEITARISIMPLRTVFSYSKTNCMHSHISQAGITRISGITGLVFELIPNLDTCFRQHEFKTNSFGLRGRETALEKPPGTYRIAFIGSSTTMGSEVAAEDIFHSFVEKKLDGSLGGRAVEVLNFGVEDYGLCDMLETLKQKALRFAPDLVIFEVTAYTAGLACDQSGSANSFSNHSPKNLFFKSYLAQVIRGRFRALGFNAYRRSAKTADEKINNLKAALRELRALKRDKKIPVAFLYINKIGHPGISLDGTGFTSLSEFVESFGVTAVDAEAYFIRQGVRKDEFKSKYWLKGHPNGAGHEHIATEIVRVLRTEKILPR
jgi:hypothetical protein